LPGPRIRASMKIPSHPPQQRFIPREISWLAFNERVLDEAAEAQNPLLERLKFLGIFSNNLDEFYRVRVAGLQRLAAERGPEERTMGVSIGRLLKDIRERVVRQAERFNQIAQTLFHELDAAGIHIVDEQHLCEEHARYVKEFFHSEVRPRLVPILCHKSRDLPVLRDPYLYLAVELLTIDSKSPSYAFIEVPTDSLSRFVILPKLGDQDYVILLEDVIRSGLGDIFSLFRPTSVRTWTIKITRDAELEIDGDETDTFVERVEQGLLKRELGAPVRVLYDQGLPEAFLRFLLHKMKLERDEALIPGQRYHNFKDFIRFPHLGRKALVRAAPEPLVHPRLRGQPSVLDVVASRDILLHYPYHGFDSVIDFLREAAIDPRVTHIRMTVYRVSHSSSVLNALINAAHNGKKVTVLVELLARFDEENNLEWVERMRLAGVEVITGVRGLKVHAKLCLVSRKEGRNQVHYAIIGTGNFNEDTARLYTDHALMTARQELTAEVLRVFDFFRNNYKVTEYRHLVVSPFHSRRAWKRMIQNEIRNAKKGRPAYVWAKLNHLADERIIEALYEASSAGVAVRLIVRGMNSLVPGIPRQSENIECVSLVGRYLEHSRFLIFCNGNSPRYFITSGDWMGRNFDGRVEVACPILDPELQKELYDYFELQWADTENSRTWDATLKNRRPTRLLEAPVCDCHREIARYLAERAEALSLDAGSRPPSGN